MANGKKGAQKKPGEKNFEKEFDNSKVKTRYLPEKFQFVFDSTESTIWGKERTNEQGSRCSQG